MMYVYYDSEGLIDIPYNKVISSGLGKKANSDGDLILSKYEKLTIDGQELKPLWTLVDYILTFDGGEGLTLGKGYEVGKNEAVEILSDTLYVSGKGGRSYADIIYDSELPNDEIRNLIEEHMIIAIDIKYNNISDDLKTRYEQLRTQAKEHKIDWN